MRRLPSAIMVIAVVALLSGCTLVQSLWSTYGPDSGRVGADEDSCLEGMNGSDSDRETVIDCDEPHLFEVTSIGAWPGMQPLINSNDGDLAAVWDAIHGAETEEYTDWASRFCSDGAQRRVGIDDVVVDGHTAGDLWLRVGGTYGVDQALAAHERFIGESDAATVCSLAWLDETGEPRLLTGPDFSTLLYPGLPLDRRECWSGNVSFIGCEEPHVAQVLLAFDGLEAFGPELIQRAATGQATDADATTATAFCQQLLLQTLSTSADLDGLGFAADIEPGPAWDAFDGTVDPGAQYYYACLAVGPQPDDELVGDVFDGTAEVAGFGP